VLVLALLFGLLFAVLAALGTYLGLSTGVVLILALSIVAAQYLAGPPLLDRIFSIQWMDPADADPELARFIRETCQRLGFRMPRFGIINDGNPNAFTYGHHRGNARLVVTRGLMEMLDEDERKAVVAHELGHIKNRDFIVMTFAAAVPIALYVLARSALWSSSARGRGALYIFAVVAVSYAIYVLSHYLVLFLSRVREYHADEVSANLTRNPNALSSALIKIAYGLARAPPRSEDWDRDTRGMLRQEGARSLGIFDPSIARSLALTASGSGASLGQRSLEEAMYWDLWNPWGRFYELTSTHPLPAKRIRRLGEIAQRMGIAPRYRFDRARPESYWDEFFIDFTVALLPLLLPAALILALILMPRGAGLLSPLPLLSLIVASVGLGLLAKTLITYPGGFREWRIRELVRQIKVSSVRAIPVRLRGRVIGRGVPGLFWSEDLVLQDTTGFVVLDYHQPIAFLNFLFGVLQAQRFVGEEVEITGWYRRSPAPRVELREIRSDELRGRCWTYHSKLLVGVLLLLLGGLLYWIG
jgi:Zn-dependent protease with chaperone function